MEDNARWKHKSIENNENQQKYKYQEFFLFSRKDNSLFTAKYKQYMRRFISGNEICENNNKEKEEGVMNILTLYVIWYNI